MEYLSLFLAFLPTYFIISISPGLNMLTSMNIGCAFGLKRALIFIFGASVAVTTIALLTIIGINALIVKIPQLFVLIKYLGAIFLCYIAVTLWRNSADLSAQNQDQYLKITTFNIILKGFITAVLNPKAWLFFIAFLPLFLKDELDLINQTMIILTIVLLVEATCMFIYALGGSFTRFLIGNKSNLLILNRINAMVMIVLAVFLLF